MQGQVETAAELVEQHEGNYVSGDLDEAGEEEDQVDVGIELRHVEGQAEVEGAQGEPGSTG